MGGIYRGVVEPGSVEERKWRGWMSRMGLNDRSEQSGEWGGMSKDVEGDSRAQRVAAMSSCH